MRHARDCGCNMQHCIGRPVANTVKQLHTKHHMRLALVGRSIEQVYPEDAESAESDVFAGEVVTLLQGSRRVLPT